jgi:hypothetical protein
MLSANCTIRALDSSSNQLLLTPSLMSKLSLSSGTKVDLVLGDRSSAVVVRTAKGKNATCYLPVSIAKEIHLPFEDKTVRMTLEKDTLFLTPIFGIMTTAMKRTIQQPFGTRSKMFESFLRSAGSEAFYFVFTPDDVDWENRTINGFFLNEGKHVQKWVQKTCPFPDVIYNRVPNRKVEVSEKVGMAKAVFKKSGIKMFNPSFFNKWEIYSMIHDHPIAGSHMPETHFSLNPNTIYEMLRRYPFLYIKPSGGSLGLGIFKLFYRPKEGYFIQYRLDDKNVLKRTNSFDSLMNFLSAQASKKGGYIAQQGIELITVNDRPVDFRVHLTKDRQNNWQVVGIGAKVAGRGSVTTHVRTGGTVTTPENVLQQVFGAHAAETLESLRATSVELAEAIEQTNRGLLGEIGFDIGIDKNAKVWMFEANSRPGFSIFKHPALKKNYRQSMRNIYEHSLYLAELHMREK